MAETQGLHDDLREAAEGRMHKRRFCIGQIRDASYAPRTRKARSTEFRPQDSRGCSNCAQALEILRWARLSGPSAEIHPVLQARCSTSPS